MDKKSDASRASLVVAISSGALFDLRDSFKIFKNQGVEAYAAHQLEQENTPLPEGPAFHLVRKLLALNSQYENLTEVILLSRNSPDTGLRVFNSIEHYKLNITRAAFTNGSSPYQYLAPLGADLFLSAYSKDVRAALAQGCAAATMLPNKPKSTGALSQDEQLRIAFDGDAVLFSDETERMFREQGLDAVAQNEKFHANTPLPNGPFYAFARALSNTQAMCSTQSYPIRTALVTARSAPAHERVIRTLRAWGIRIDEAYFLGGRSKGEVLSAFKADIFFDDQTHNCDSAGQYVTTGHVPFGIGNDPDEKPVTVDLYDGTD